MTWNKNNKVNESSEWGGPWTEKKLEAFSKYVRSYLTIMNKYPFWKTIYFDGFAGSGTREKQNNTELMLQLNITEELVPTGVIVNRLLDRAGKLKFSNKLQSFFGLTIEEIKNYFYTEQIEQTLFGEEEIITKVQQPIEKIAYLYAERLNTIWKHVTEKPLVLTNRNGTPIFHLIFASNNQNALKIAKQIILNT